MTDSIDDLPTILHLWDGCSWINVTSDPQMNAFGADVPGIGYVSVPTRIKDTLPKLENLFCKWTPGGLGLG